MTLTRIRARLRDQRGATSVAELAVVALLMGLVGAVIMASLTSSVRAASAVQDQNASIQEVRTALEVIERDLRAANPIDALPSSIPVSQYATSLSFSVYCATAGTGDCGTNNLRAVVYRLNGTRLERVQGSTTGVLAAPSGPVHLPAAQQRGAVVNTASEPVFRYFDKDGNELATSGTDASPSSHFRDCVRHVEIFLRIVTEAGETPKTAALRTSGTLRNFNEVDGC